MGSSGTGHFQFGHRRSGTPLRNVLWGSQKEPHEDSGVWQAVACSASPHCHRRQAVLLTHVGVSSPESPSLSQLQSHHGQCLQQSSLRNALPHIRAHLHAGRGTECICASVPNSTRQDDSRVSQSQGKSTESTLTEARWELRSQHH